MSSSQTILQKNYTEGKAITEVEIAVVDPISSRQVIFKKNVQIDTGFDSGVQIRELDAGELDNNWHKTYSWVGKPGW